MRERQQNSVGGAGAFRARLRTEPARTPDLTIVAPTRNEEAVIGAFIESLDAALSGIDAELIVVDDSDDDTPAVVAERGAAAGLQVALIHRAPGERDGGLGGAVVAGIAAARAPWVCVMDADLQHPPAAIAALREQAESSNSDLVVASRFRKGGSIAGLSSLRKLVSRTLVGLARAAFPFRLRSVTDPLTGFFLVRRDALDLTALRPNGFKILLEILVRSPKLAVSEIAFQFGVRPAGESKASLREVARYLTLVWRLRLGTLGSRFGRFGLVGLSGIAVNSLALVAFRAGAGFGLLAAALLATQCSSIWNFLLVERFVFRDNSPSRSYAARAVAFLAMNNLAFGLRGPMLLALTSVFGMHYVLANLISLCSLTVARFALADRWIWGTARETRALYDIHDLVTVDSDVVLPELARFRVPALDHPASIRVTVESLGEISRLGHGLSEDGDEVITYREAIPGGFAVRINKSATVSIAVSPLVRRSPHVLYTNCVEPVLRWHFAELGIALVHAACVALDERAFLITARTDTGKTTTILRLLDAFPRPNSSPTTSRSWPPTGASARASPRHPLGLERGRPAVHEVLVEDVRRVSQEVRAKEVAYRRLSDELRQLRARVRPREVRVALREPALPERCIIAGRVNASARKITSGAAREPRRSATPRRQPASCAGCRRGTRARRARPDQNDVAQRRPQPAPVLATRS